MKPDMLIKRTIQTFEVSLKAALFKDGKLLLVKEADTGFWELPGGRIDAGEEWDRHGHILAREIREELGPEVRVTLWPDATSFVRQRPADGVYQFLLVRLGAYEGGMITLSDEHMERRWVGPDAWQGLTFPERSGYPAALEAVWELARGKGV